MMKKDSLVKMEYDDLNPYILDDSVRKKLNTTHYVLGEERYRDLQNRHKARLDRLNEIANKFNVKLENTVDIDDVIHETELSIEYFKNKEKYDNLVNDMLKHMTPEQLYNGLEKYL